MNTNAVVPTTTGDAVCTQAVFAFAVPAFTNTLAPGIVLPYAVSYARCSTQFDGTTVATGTWNPEPIGLPRRMFEAVRTSATVYPVPAVVIVTDATGANTCVTVIEKPEPAAVTVATVVEKPEPVPPIFAASADSLFLLR